MLILEKNKRQLILPKCRDRDKGRKWFRVMDLTEKTGLTPVKVFRGFDTYIYIYIYVHLMTQG